MKLSNEELAAIQCWLNNQFTGQTIVIRYINYWRFLDPTLYLAKWDFICFEHTVDFVYHSTIESFLEHLKVEPEDVPLILFNSLLMDECIEKHKTNTPFKTIGITVHDAWHY